MPERALQTLTVLLANVDPSPALVSLLLSNIAVPLYALLSELDHIKTSDPELKETLRGLLATWGRLVNASDGVTILWAIVQGDGGFWQASMTGEISRVEKYVFTLNDTVVSLNTK
jgi:hypothetical protein